MARIDTSLAQTKAQRDAKKKAKDKKLADAIKRANDLREAANKRPRGPMPVHKTKPTQPTVSRRTLKERLIDAQAAGFATVAEHEASK